LGRGLLICRKTRPVLVVTERNSWFTIATKLVGRTAQETMTVFERLNPRPRRSILSLPIRADYRE
jgi:hypothetical protein